MKARTELVILKLGGSVITRKDEGRAEVNKDNLARLSGEIADAQKEKKFLVVIVHGAGPFGHILAKAYPDAKWHNTKIRDRFHMLLSPFSQNAAGKTRLSGFSCQEPGCTASYVIPVQGHLNHIPR